MNMSNNDFDLRRRLRQLPRERDPGRDLWPGIVAQVQSRPQQGSRRRARIAAGMGLLAASVALAWVLTSLHSPSIPADAGLTRRAASPMPQWVRLEADAITIEYQRAYAPFAEMPMPVALHGAVIELDHSATQLRAALRAQPDAVYLLERLRQTYDQRLHLLQRAALG
jgi:hypothetical protein